MTTERVTEHVNRLEALETWRRDQGQFYSTDIDGIEYKLDENGEPVIVAIVEYTWIHTTPPQDKTLQDILVRIKKDGSPHRVGWQIAEAMGVDYWVVVHTEDGKQFWLCNLTRGVKWIKAVNRTRFRDFLKYLRR